MRSGRDRAWRDVRTTRCHLARESDTGSQLSAQPSRHRWRLRRRDGKLCGEGEWCARLLLFGAIGIVFGLETLKVEFDVALGHAQALVPQKLFDSVDINALLNHLRGNRMAKLMSRDGVGLAFMQQMGR